MRYGVDERLRAAWSDNRVYQGPGCMACWARYLCGGGCRHHRLEISGRIDAPAPAQRRIRKIIIRECLWILCELGPEKLKAFIR